MYSVLAYWPEGLVFVLNTAGPSLGILNTSILEPTSKYNHSEYVCKTLFQYFYIYKQTENDFQNNNKGCLKKSHIGSRIILGA